MAKVAPADNRLCGFPDENARYIFPAMQEVADDEDEGNDDREEEHSWMSTCGFSVYFPNCAELSHLPSEKVRSLERRIVNTHKRLWSLMARSNQKRSCATFEKPFDQTLVYPMLQYTPRPPRTGSFVMREASKNWCEGGSVSTAATVETAMSNSSSSQNECRSLADLDADEEVETICDGGNCPKQAVIRCSRSNSPCAWGYFVDTGSPSASRQANPAPWWPESSCYRRFLSKELAASERYCVSSSDGRRQAIHRVKALPNLR